MNICFYAPFKPLGHPNPSGDLIIASGLYDYFKKQGHRVWPVSSLRARWIYWKPWKWPQILKERRGVLRRTGRERPDLWFTYHTYYKSPDLLGPFAARSMMLPYVIFQGIFSTKRKRRWRTWPGYFLNKRALCAARHVFTNRHEDHINLLRLVPRNRITYVAPGIYPDDFRFSPTARSELRRTWNVGDDPVLLSAAMFRPGVKTQGLTWVIRSGARLFQKGIRFHLVIAGEGKEKDNLHRLAEELLPGRVRFIGKISREMMYRFYSAGDIFVFPGIRETLGMVFLEAQSCGLPVVAFENGGIPEVVKNGETGFLAPLYAMDPFVEAMERLITDKDLRLKMGEAAGIHVRNTHDLNRNYRKVEEVLKVIVQK